MVRELEKAQTDLIEARVEKDELAKVLVSVLVLVLSWGLGVLVS